ncbi:MAG: histidine kinase N-terminal 7TM domain-containing protein [Acholeplasmataceae bacterium]
MQFYVITLFIIIFIFIGLFIYMLFKKNNLSFVFAIFSLLSIFYIAGILGQLLSNDLETAKFFHKVKYIGAPLIPSIFLLFLCRLKNYRFPDYKVTATLLSIPIMVIFIMFTNDFHQLYYLNVDYEMFHGYLVLVFDRGPLYYSFTLVQVTIMIINFYLLIKLKMDQYKEYSLFSNALIVS